MSFATMSFASKAYLFVLLAGFCMLAPLFSTTPMNLQDTVYTESLKLERFASVTLVGVTLMVPAICEHILDGIYFKTDSNFLIRLSFILLVFLSFLGEHIVCSSFSDRREVFACFVTCQFSVVIGTSTIYLHSLLDIVKNRNLFLMTMFFFTYVAIFLTYLNGYVEDSSHLMYILSQASVTLCFVSFLAFIGTSLFKHVILWRLSLLSIREWYRTMSPHPKSSLNTSVVVLAITVTVAFIATRVLGQTNSEQLVMSRLSTTVAVALFVAIFTSRRARLECEILRGELEMKRTFVRFVSHEIRTPLNIVTAGLKYVEDKMAAAGVSDRCPELLSTLTDMNESTSVVTSILDDLLIHEKIAAGQMKLEQVQVDASTFIAKSIQLFRAQASHKRVLLNIVNRLEAGMHAILIDESKMTQVLRSIVLYAIRVTPELGTVEAHMYEADGCVTVEVTDSGPGTSEENKKQLFANVVQLDGRGDVALGLWISAKIMAMHGGEVGVRSDGEGRGSTFFVKIPLSTSLLTAVAPQQCRSSDQARVSVRVHPELTLREKIRRRFSMQDVASYRVVNDRVRILLVDDSALNRRILNRLLLADGFSGDEADDGEVAVRMCDVTSGGVAYDLVLMDHIMPHMSGPAATKELRRRGFQGVIVGITGNTAPADIKNFVDHGADAVLSKPLSVDEIRELIAMIHESLKVRQSMEE